MKNVTVLCEMDVFIFTRYPTLYLALYLCSVFLFR